MDSVSLIPIYWIVSYPGVSVYKTGEDQFCCRKQIQLLNKFKYMYYVTRESGVFTVSSLVVSPPGGGGGVL